MSNIVDNIVEHLQHAADVQAQVTQEGRLNKLIELKEWQCNRLLASHYNLWQVTRFQPAITFFIDELYGPKDFSQRDAEIAKVLPKMAKWLPDEALESLAVAIHLNSLSQDLDVAILDNLPDDNLNAKNYAIAYRASNNQAARTQQIDYIEALGMDLAKVVKIPGISMILKMARAPAKALGVEELQRFLEDGFQAFKQLGKVEDFIIPIIAEERRIMEALFAGQEVLPDI
ncbi:hypothetical protein KIH87_12400 [Paraneptunicella aestuarii]|uniref:FFLEELY motif protein n=1 Tax=Paraneptunicella aestuarii TaxID=2831148 RepID=UPI001E373E5A|nr:hypothetical protein [Paraneptunicella aestuarii]UAA37513.1 hypothetical protein KIH87_12400 [Paraneptunicella aestuarii]